MKTYSLSSEFVDGLTYHNKILIEENNYLERENQVLRSKLAEAN